MRRAVGWSLVVLSMLAVAQTAREIALWEYGRRTYSERSVHTRTFMFGGRTFTVTDDQPSNGTHSQAEFDAVIQPRVDGGPLGPPSRARVRPGIEHLGRYHLWYDAWVFVDRARGDSSLWLARRLQPTDRSVPHFELTVVDPSGRIHRDVRSRWTLDGRYRVFRSTQFVHQSEWTVMPLSLTGMLGLFPLLLVLFPVGSLLLGWRLLRRTARG